jgi:protein-tyrosine-phosphatase
VDAGEPCGRARVLFLCTHNSARSQIAEELLRHLAGDRFEAHSAGTEATHIRPLAVRVMEEMRVDISGQESRTLDWYLQEPFEYVITVCVYLLRTPVNSAAACVTPSCMASWLHLSEQSPRLRGVERSCQYVRTQHP